jgi:hypothetical protein
VRSVSARSHSTLRGHHITGARSLLSGEQLVRAVVRRPEAIDSAAEPLAATLRTELEEFRGNGGGQAAGDAG